LNDAGGYAPYFDGTIASDEGIMLKAVVPNDFGKIRAV
jgi:hypothetical protein